MRTIMLKIPGIARKWVSPKTWSAVSDTNMSLWLSKSIKYATCVQGLVRKTMIWIKRGEGEVKQAAGELLNLSWLRLV